jgi:hypothetical protein
MLQARRAAQPGPPVSRAALQPRLTLPAARPLLHSTPYGLFRTTLSATSALPLTQLNGDLFATPQPFLSPGAFVPGATVGGGGGGGGGAPGAGGMARSAGGLHGVGSLFLPFGILGYGVLPTYGSLHTTALSLFNGSSIGLFGVQRSGGVSHSLLGLMGNGFASLGTGRYTFTPGHVMAQSLLVAGWRDNVGLGGQMVWANTATGQIMLFGAQIGKTARRDVADLGAVKQHAAVLRAAHHLAADSPLRRIQITRRTGEAYSLRGAAGTFMVALMVRLELLRGRQTLFRTHVGEAQARQILFEKGHVRKYFREKARALQWIKEVVDVPNLNEVSRLRLGDELNYTRSGTFILGALLGSLSFWAGVNVTHRGELEIDVRKVGKKLVEVALTPTRAAAKLVYAAQPFGPHAGFRVSHARVLRQVFVLDLQVAAARSAYQELIAGRLAATLRPPRFAAHTSMGQALADYLRQQKKTLPEGVTQTAAQALQAATRDVGGGLKWLFLPKEITPHGWMMGLNWHRQYGSEHHTLTDGEAVSDLQVSQRSTFSERLWGGFKLQQVTSVQRAEGSRRSRPQFASLEVSVNSSDTHTQHGGHNKRFIARLSHQFGLPLRRAQLSHRHEDRLVQVARSFTPPDLQALTALGTQLYGADRLAPGTKGRAAGWLQAANAVQHGHLAGRHLRPFLKALAKDGTPANPTKKAQTAYPAAASARQAVDADSTDLAAAPARLLQKLMRRHGVAAVATAHRLVAGTSAALRLSTVSDVYEQALAAAGKIVFKYSDPQPLSCAAWVTRLREGVVSLQRVQRALTRLGDDGLQTPPSRQKLRVALFAAQQRLQRMIEVPEPQRAAVLQQLGRGWIFRTWRRHAALMLHLRPLQAQALSQLQRHQLAEIAYLLPSGSSA